MSNYSTVQKFAAGGVPRTYSQSVFADTDRDSRVLYSYGYGTHFPMVIVRADESVILNGDRYSVTTNRHQSLARSAFPNSPIVPFSALRAAGRDPFTVEIVDYTTDYSDGAYFNAVTEKDKIAAWKSRQPSAATITTHRLNSDPENHEITFHAHLLGGTLLRDPNNGDLLVASIDEGTYFISALTARYPTTFNEAIESLKPGAVKQALNEGLEVIRQGEFFFIPRGQKPRGQKLGKNFRDKYFRLENENSGGGNNVHVATAGYTGGNNVFVTGTVRHLNVSGWDDSLNASGEHRMIRLAKGTVYQAVENTARESWSIGGNVD